MKQLEEAGESVSEPGRPRGVILVPTSDLGEQVAKVFKTFTHDTRLRVRTALGGSGMADHAEKCCGSIRDFAGDPGTA